MAHPVHILIHDTRVSWSLVQLYNIIALRTCTNRGQLREANIEPTRRRPFGSMPQCCLWGSYTFTWVLVPNRPIRRLFWLRLYWVLYSCYACTIGQTGNNWLRMQSFRLTPHIYFLNKTVSVHVLFLVRFATFLSPFVLRPSDSVTSANHGSAVVCLSDCNNCALIFFSGFRNSSKLNKNQKFIRYWLLSSLSKSHSFDRPLFNASLTIYPRLCEWFIASLF